MTDHISNTTPPSRSVTHVRPRRRTPRRIVIVATCVALTVVSMVFVLGPADGTAADHVSSSEARPAIELLPRDLATATTRIMQRTVPLTGTLQPLNQTEVRARQAGELRAVQVREGEQVAQGQILATLDATDLEARLRDKEGALEAGKAQLALARKNLNKNASLLRESFISQAAFDGLRNSHEISEATLVSLRAQLVQAQKALSDAVVRAPMDGVIAERFAQPGQAVAVNGALFSIQDLTTMNVKALVPASDIPVVALGQQARLRIEGFGEQEFVGTVDRINPSTEKNTRSIAIHVRVSNADGQIRGGMFAQGTLAVSTPISVTAVPRAAVRERGGLSSVLRIDDGQLVEQPVETGMVDASTDTVEIRTGLMSGATVVASKLDNLSGGQSIRIVPLPNTNP